MASRLAMALTELGALPAMYRRITTTVVTGASAVPAFVGLRATSRFLVAVLDGFCGNPAGAALPGCRSIRHLRPAHSAQLVLPFARGHVPRHLMTVSARLRSPPRTRYDRWIQVSAIVGICRSVASACRSPPSTSEVMTTVISWSLTL